MKTYGMIYNGEEYEIDYWQDIETGDIDIRVLYHDDRDITELASSLGLDWDDMTNQMHSELAENGRDVS